MSGLFPLPRPNAEGYYADRAWLDEVAGLSGRGFGKTQKLAQQRDLEPIEGEMTMHPGAPRDVNLDEWLDGIGFKPADTERKQLGHEAARQTIAEVGRLLHGLLPAGRVKSLVFTDLERVLHRANQALAVGGGPHEWIDDDTLRRLAAHGPLVADPRVEEYKAGQRGEKVITEARPVEAVHEHEPAEPTETYREEVRGAAGETVLQVSGSLFRAGGYVDLAVVCTDRETVDQVIQDARFAGFHRTLDTAEQVQHAVNAILTAAEHAGLGHVESPIK
jgi:hypothetical protein